jgi:hypothetical protein
MNWKGEEILTTGDLCYKGIDKCDTPEEAQEFMELYRAENDHADENIGYLSGYYDPAGDASYPGMVRRDAPNLR